MQNLIESKYSLNLKWLLIIILQLLVNEYSKLYSPKDKRERLRVIGWMSGNTGLGMC